MSFQTLYVLVIITLFTPAFAEGKLALIAHRGGMPHLPENSRIAFEEALRFTPNIETDIHFTRDDIPVILHDRTLDRTTDCHGLLSERTWEEVRTCRLQTPSGRLSHSRLPSLRSVLNDRALRSAKMIFEVKDYNPKGIDRLMRRIRNRKEIRLSSFDLRTLTYLHTHYHFRHLILIAWHLPRTIPRWIGSVFLCASYANLSALQHAPRRGHLYLWTVNRLRELPHLRPLPIDGIITDRVRFFREKL